MRDPHEPGSWGLCPFLALTGRPCPLCGGLRAINDLVRGRLGAALSSNLLVVAAVAAAAVGLLWWAARRAAGTGAEKFPFPAGRRTRWAELLGLALLVVAFGVARWTPALAWAAP